MWLSCQNLLFCWGIVEFPIFFHSSLQFVIMSDLGAFLDLNQCQCWRRWHDISYCFASLCLYLALVKEQIPVLKLENWEYWISSFNFCRYEIVITWSFNSCVCSFQDIYINAGSAITMFILKSKLQISCFVCIVSTPLVRSWMPIYSHTFTHGKKKLKHLISCWFCRICWLI